MTDAFKLKGSGPARKLFILAVQGLLLFYAVLIIYPLLNMIFSSFKTTREIFQNPFGLPATFSFGNYTKVWLMGGFEQYMLNSLMLTAGTMVIVILIGSMASFGVSRYTYALRTAVSMVFLGGIMLPLNVAIIPLFIMIKSLKLMDTHAALYLVFTAMCLPSTVFILSGFMKTIPSELEDAARMDGTNDFGIYWHVALPLSAPSLALVTIYNAVPVWNDFFFPLVFIQTNAKKPLPLGLTSFIGQYDTDWGLVFTALTVAILPILILYIFMSRYFIKGMTMGAIK